MRIEDIHIDWQEKAFVLLKSEWDGTFENASSILNESHSIVFTTVYVTKLLMQGNTRPRKVSKIILWMESMGSVEQKRRKRQVSKFAHL